MLSAMKSLACVGTLLALSTPAAFAEQRDAQQKDAQQKECFTIAMTNATTGGECWDRFCSINHGKFLGARPHQARRRQGNHQVVPARGRNGRNRHRGWPRLSINGWLDADGPRRGARSFGA